MTPQSARTTEIASESKESSTDEMAICFVELICRYKSVPFVTSSYSLSLSNLFRTCCVDGFSVIASLGLFYIQPSAVGKWLHDLLIIFRMVVTGSMVVLSCVCLLFWADFTVVIVLDAMFQFSIEDLPRKRRNR